jgi:hypothetical protein
LQQFVLARRLRHETDTALAQDARDLMEFYLFAPSLVGGDKDKARATEERIAGAASGSLQDIVALRGKPFPLNGLQVPSRAAGSRPAKLFGERPGGRKTAGCPARRLAKWLIFKGMRRLANCGPRAPVTEAA